MKRAIQFFSALAAATVLWGCGDETPKMVPRPEMPKEDYTEKPTDFTVFNPKVDILFVIDDSGSMSSAQQNMSQNIAMFSSTIAQMSVLDYHIGVVTTDMDSYSRKGRLVGSPAYVEKTTPDLVARLSRNMLVGINGSGTEYMFNPVLAALTSPLDTTMNLGFHRKDAYLAVIFLTDADDQGNYSARDFHQELVKIKGNTDKVLGYGVIRTLATAKSCDGMEEIYGKNEEFLSLVVNGGKTQKNVLSFCSTDYGTKLAEFARDIVSRSAGTVKLNRVPKVETIKVTYGTQVIPNDAAEGWVYVPSTNSLRLAAGIKWEDQGPNVGLTVDFEVIDMTPF